MGFRQAAHPHHVVDHLAVGAPHLQHAGVHVRCQASVELDLAATHLGPRLHRAVVEEAEIDRFAHLVGFVATEEDERAVGLHHHRRPPRLRARPTEGVHSSSLGARAYPRGRSGRAARSPAATTGALG